MMVSMLTIYFKPTNKHQEVFSSFFLVKAGRVIEQLNLFQNTMPR